ncbi:serine protease [Ancylobacter sp. MQZ15Z-1]|uniref:Serine protease n=1 Tax=Ancylobacter mangrovi TaxID=2972472 RepID=A0A9X2T3A5_9HYPH|nr:serine protease [Ancylobacter mangrovi]MCS0494781.1 serine protease [Ancylobacter mangrovi]
MARRLPVLLLVAATAPLGPAIAAAESFVPPPGTHWVTLASTGDIDVAIGIARAYGGKARVVKAKNGWYAVTLEPRAGTLEAIRRQIDWPPLPADALLSKGSGYMQTVWRASEVEQARATVTKDTPGTARMDGLSVTLTRERAPEGWTAHLVGRDAGGVAFDLRHAFPEAVDYESSLTLVELDRTNATPEIVFDAFSGGAHCCTTSIALTRSRAGDWRFVDLGTRDGGGLDFEDVDGDGAAEIVRGDERFLYTFDSYAGSMQPILIDRLDGTELDEVTMRPAFRHRLVQDARWMEFYAKLEPDQWHANGFLAAWVAARTRIGEGNEAWERMLPLYDRNSDFGLDTCAVSVALKDCPAASRRKLPFPEGLRRFMKETGYGDAPGGESPTAATQPPATQPPASTTLKQARAAFLAMPLKKQQDIQVLLAVTGYWPAVAGDSFGPKLMAAIRSFQRDLGRVPSGIVGDGDYEALRQAASPLLRMWSLERVTHPGTRAALWVPSGLAPLVARTDGGLSFSSAQDDVSVSFSYLPRVSAIFGYQVLTGALKEHVIDYSVVKPDFFVISSHLGQMSQYTRFEETPGGVVGFTLIWPSDSPVHGERLSTVMSDLFRAENELGQRRSPPEPLAEVALAPDRRAEPTIAHAAPVDPDATEETTGSGFFVTADELLTNAHVVRGCTSVTVAVGGEGAPGTVLGRDETNDLALVRTSARSRAVAKLRSGVRLGEDVAVFGYPLSGLLASSGNFTKGTVTATAGMGDDTRRLQISAPVQPGNSGGPLLDEAGNVVGVVVSKINAVAVAAVTDDIPQNINFAIKTAIAVSFLEAKGVGYTAGAPGEALKSADLAEKAQSFSAAISCIR